jgi:hypothetical protein
MRLNAGDTGTPIRPAPSTGRIGMPDALFECRGVEVGRAGALGGSRAWKPPPAAAAGPATGGGRQEAGCRDGTWAPVNNPVGTAAASAP